MNLYVIIPMKKILFSVNLDVFIPMMLFMVKIFNKLLNICTQGNGRLFICIYSNEKVFI